MIGEFPRRGHDTKRLITGALVIGLASKRLRLQCNNGIRGNCCSCDTPYLDFENGETSGETKSITTPVELWGGYCVRNLLETAADVPLNAQRRFSVRAYLTHRVWGKGKVDPYQRQYWTFGPATQGALNIEHAHF